MLRLKLRPDRRRFAQVSLVQDAAGSLPELGPGRQRVPAEGLEGHEGTRQRGDGAERGASAGTRWAQPSPVLPAARVGEGRQEGDDVHGCLKRGVGSPAHSRSPKRSG